MTAAKPEVVAMEEDTDEKSRKKTRKNSVEDAYFPSLLNWQSLTPVPNSSFSNADLALVDRSGRKK